MSYMESAVIATSEVMSMNQSSEDHSSKACRWLVAVFLSNAVDLSREQTSPNQ